MDPSLAEWLCSPAGRALLEAAHDASGLALLERPRALAGRGTPEQVRAALAQVDLRERAAAKTPHARRLLFTREALEQATPHEVAQERARRWPLPRSARVADLGAGIGLDALALAEAGRPVLAVERDPVRARLLRHNVEALGLSPLVEVREGDLAAGPHPAAGAFLDPDRRPGGVRRRDPERFEPPRSTWSALLAPYPVAVVKAAPVDPPGPPNPVPFEVVSLRGEARERRLWWAGFPAAPPRRALALPSERSVEGVGRPWPLPRAPAAGLHLLDPDPAVTVADLVGDLCLRDDLAPIHPRIAYLVATRPVPASPGTWVAIDALLPPDARALNAWLAGQGVGRLEVRSRGVAEDAGAWRQRLQPRGPHAGTLVFTRGPDDRWVVLGSVRRAP